MPLPELISLPAHHSVVSRGPRERQLGLDPERAVGVGGLAPPLAQLLDELTEPDGTASLLARAVRRGADRGEAEALLATLVGEGALVDAGVTGRTLRRRRDSTVLVEGAGPITPVVAHGLVGVGVGTGGGAVHVVGPPGAEPVAPPRTRADLVVLADTLVPAPERLLQLHVDGTPHLHVRMRDGVGVVGPLVLPGRSACLRCLDLRRTDRDPGWPTVAMQLTGRVGRGDPACAAATSALGVTQALLALDGTGPPPLDPAGPGEPPTLEVSIELDLATGTTRKRRWSPHPRCPCGAADTRRPDRRAESG